MVAPSTLLPQETMDMVSPAMQLASKIPDKKLQVWAATLLAGERIWDRTHGGLFVYKEYQMMFWQLYSYYHAAVYKAIKYIESLLKYCCTCREQGQLDSHQHVCWSGLVRQSSFCYAFSEVTQNCMWWFLLMVSSQTNLMPLLFTSKQWPESTYSVLVKLDGTFRPASAECLPRQWNLLRLVGLYHQLRLVAMPLGHLGHVPPHMNLVRTSFHIFTIVVRGFGYIKSYTYSLYM